MDIATTTPQKVERANITETTNSGKIYVEPEDRHLVESAKKTLNVKDVNSIITFGAAAQQPLESLSDQMLKNVKARDSGEVGEQLTSMVVSMKKINLDALGNEKKQSFFSRILGKVSNPIEKFNEQFDTIADVVEKGKINLEQKANIVMKDNNFLDTQRVETNNVIRNISVAIAAIEETIDEYDNTIIAELVKKYEETGSIIDGQNVNDATETKNLLEIRKTDLLKSQHIATVLNIRNAAIKKTNNLLISQIQTQVVLAIPMWKTEISQRIMNGRRKDAVTSLRESTDYANQLFRASAEELRQTNKEILVEANRGIIDVETIKIMTNELIGTLNDTIEINQKAREERIKAEAEIKEEAVKLKQALISSVYKQADINAKSISTDSTTPVNVFAGYNNK